MEKVFKTKRTRNWWIIIVGLVVLIIFLNVYLEKSWAFSALGGIIIPVLMFYSRSKTTYIVKDNGVLEIKPGWGNRICVDGIRKVSYNPNAIGMQKVKIEHAQGFVMINPDKPLEFVEALIKIDPNLSVEGFEQIKLINPNKYHEISNCNHRWRSRRVYCCRSCRKGRTECCIVRKRSLGGVCLNEGCIPTKTLLYSAKVYDYAKHASKYAVNVPEASFDLGKIVARKSKVVRKLVLGIKAKLTAHQVNIVTGEAVIVDKNTIQCGGETYECENLLLCTGSETFIPPIPGVENVDYWTHRDALDNKEIPASLTIVGGGVIGMEFASFFTSLGVQVTVVEMLDEILGGMDKELSAMLRAEYAKKGIKFLLSTKVVGVSKEETGITVSYENADGTGTVTADKLLMSVGRRPVTKGFGLENLNLEWTERRCIKVDEHLQSSVPGVYVCGDLNGVSLLAHTAVREAEVAVHHITGKEDAMSYRAIPGVVYTNPEIAGVGMSEEALQAAGIPYRAVKLPMAYSGRFVAENEGVNGVCKILTAEDGTVLGAHMLGNPASELIVLAGMAIEDGKTIEDWKRYVFPHPTVGEIFREL